MLLLYVARRRVMVNVIVVCCQTEDDGDLMHASDRLTVKQSIIALMLKSPEQIQKQV